MSYLVKLANDDEEVKRVFKRRSPSTKRGVKRDHKEETGGFTTTNGWSNSVWGKVKDTPFCPSFNTAQKKRDEEADIQRQRTEKAAEWVEKIKTHGPLDGGKLFGPTPHWECNPIYGLQCGHMICFEIDQFTHDNPSPRGEQDKEISEAYEKLKRQREDVQSWERVFRRQPQEGTAEDTGSLSSNSLPSPILPSPNPIEPSLSPYIVD
jgi:hypothetical protein